MKRKGSLATQETLKKAKPLRLRLYFPLADLPNDLLAYMLRLNAWRDAEALLSLNRGWLQRLCSPGMLEQVLEDSKAVSRRRGFLGFRGPRYLRFALPLELVAENQQELEEMQGALARFPLTAEAVAARYATLVEQSQTSLHYGWTHECSKLEDLTEFAVAGGAVCRELYSTKEEWEGRWSRKDSDLDVWVRVPLEEKESEYKTKDYWSAQARMLRVVAFKLLTTEPDWYEARKLRNDLERGEDVLAWGEDIGSHQSSLDDDDVEAEQQEGTIRVEVRQGIFNSGLGAPEFVEEEPKQPKDNFSLHEYKGADVLVKVPATLSGVEAELRGYYKLKYSRKHGLNQYYTQKSRHTQALDMVASRQQKMQKLQVHANVFKRPYAAIETFDVSLAAVALHFAKDSTDGTWKRSAYLTPQALHTYRTKEVLVNAGDVADFTAYRGEDLEKFTGLPIGEKNINIGLLKQTDVLKNLSEHLWCKQVPAPLQPDYLTIYQRMFAAAVKRGEKRKLHEAAVQSCTRCLQEIAEREKYGAVWVVEEEEESSRNQLEDTLKHTYVLKSTVEASRIQPTAYHTWFKRIHKYKLRFPKYSWHFFVAPLGMLGLALEDMHSKAQEHWCELRHELNLYHEVPCICGKCTDVSSLGRLAQVKAGLAELKQVEKSLVGIKKRK